MARKRKTMDGNTAAAWASYAFTDVAAIYPITPSSNMAEITDKWATEGKKNLFGNTVKIAEMQSEAGAAGAVHGSITAGALTTTYTASQGLLLMIPNMYKIAGELLPNVINVSARALASHALSIFGDHQDIYACRQTGYAFLASTNPQEAMDLGAVAHLSTIEARVPFVHFFDGFRTSHEYQKIEVWDNEDLRDITPFDKIEEFRNKSLNPEHPAQRGTAQNPDIFFQAREAANKYYEAVPEICQKYMDKVNEKIGTDYKLFNYYGALDAEVVLVAMGSVCDTICETIDYLNKNGMKTGVIKVRLYRPFSSGHFAAAVPKSCKRIVVLDRTKEAGSVGEPLYLDVCASCVNENITAELFSGRYGLASKDTTPSQIIAAFKNTEKKRFTIGIEDDVTFTSLDITENPDTTPEGITSCKFWGLGSDGTVGANKNSVKIIGDHTDMNVQAYFDYDSKKSGGLTVSHLRFGNAKITSTYLVNKADFVACHKDSYIRKYDMVSDVKEGGVFLLNCPWKSIEELEENIPGQVRRHIAQNNINFYVIDGFGIGKEIGLGSRINTILQSAFFKLADIIPYEDAVKYMKDAATATYAKKGEEIVKMNHDAIDAGAKRIVKVDVPSYWKDAKDEELVQKAVGEGKLVDYVNEILLPVSRFAGGKLPVSAFEKYANGEIPSGSAAYEKRGIAIDVPSWEKDKCLQCNMCSYVCPHAVIRPVALADDEVKNAPDGMKYVKMKQFEDMNYAISVSALDCTGCGTCAAVCPGKCLTMLPLETQLESQAYFDYTVKLPEKEEVIEKFKPTTVKGSQFKQPYLEFSGACAGCGETPYAKLATQIAGDRMYIANATGCSSIWGGSAPATPYTVNMKGEGPAWANSLFEDNAEYGYGMFLAQDTLRNQLIEKIEKMKDDASDDAKEIIDKFLTTKNDGRANKAAARDLVELLGTMNSETAKEILKKKEYLAKKSVYIFGGDGWAYDIGFGGLDHVIASHSDVNIVVFDTEVYSNTGGQASKATPTGAIAKFAAAGKEVKKKDLAAIAMSYGYVYTAQVAMGANPAQCIKAFAEAESYDGPSVVICYAPCINHGIKEGLVAAQAEEKRAVEAGYWHLFRYDPRLEKEGKNPFQLDSKEPKASYEDFIMNEVRYSSLAMENPERAKELFAFAEKTAKEKYEKLKKMAE